MRHQLRTMTCSTAPKQFIYYATRVRTPSCRSGTAEEEPHFLVIPPLDRVQVYEVNLC